ncbi:MAG TPA: peptidylprolyl isomerase [Pyrinomonadaceae bacterium]|nr:peptidylprolyl isomerase [Pyrinomonadaceae bacterium]
MKYSRVKLLILTLCVSACGVAARAQQQQQPTPAQATSAQKANARPSAEPAAPVEPFDKATPAELSAQCVTLETEAGAVEVEILGEAAPENARNFLNLVAAGAYDTTTFGRVVRGFVIQGGDLATREKLTPELARRARRTVADEPNLVKHARGVVSMARTSEPDSATTSFFILVGDGSHLDGTFSAFGRVRSGMEVVDAINQAEVEGEKPVKPVRLTRATVKPCG